MKACPAHLAVALAFLTACWRGETAAASHGCTKDTDCKGDRLCIAGACADAPARPSSSPPSEHPTAAPVPPAPSAAARNWTGTYVVSDLCGQTFGGTGIAIAYNLRVFREGAATLADIDADGWQTMKRLRARVDAQGDRANFVFIAPREGNMFDENKPGEVLFTIAFAGGRPTTTWLAMDAPCGKKTVGFAVDVQPPHALTGAPSSAGPR